MFGMTGAASPIGPVQLDGAKLAVKEINAAGGVTLGGKKVPVEFVVRDDETKPDIAIRRFRELLTEEKVDLIVGQTFAPISGALNKEVKKTPVLYFPVNVVALKMFEKAEMAPSTFAPHGSAYAAGYAGAGYIIKNLGIQTSAAEDHLLGPASSGRTSGPAQRTMKKYGVQAEYLESPVGTGGFTRSSPRLRR